MGQECESGSWKRKPEVEAGSGSWKRLNICGSGSTLKKEAKNRSKKYSTAFTSLV